MAGLLQTVAAKWTTTADDEPNESCQKIRLDEAMTTADGELEAFRRGRISGSDLYLFLGEFSGKKTLFFNLFLI